MQVAVNTPRTYDLMNVSEEVLKKYPDLWTQVQSSNGASKSKSNTFRPLSVQKKRAKRNTSRAAKRSSAPKATKLVKAKASGRGHTTNTMKCPFGGEEIGTQGWQNHVRGEAGRAKWAKQDIENLILTTTAERAKKN